VLVWGASTGSQHSAASCAQRLRLLGTAAHTHAHPDSRRAHDTPRCYDVPLVLPWATLGECGPRARQHGVLLLRRGRVSGSSNAMDAVLFRLTAVLSMASEQKLRPNFSHCCPTHHYSPLLSRPLVASGLTAAPARRRRPTEPSAPAPGCRATQGDRPVTPLPARPHLRRARQPAARPPSPHPPTTPHTHTQPLPHPPTRTTTRGRPGVLSARPAHPPAHLLHHDVQHIAVLNFELQGGGAAPTHGLCRAGAASRCSARPASPCSTVRKSKQTRRPARPPSRACRPP
jgi:hypothetical protein